MAGNRPLDILLSVEAANLILNHILPGEDIIPEETKNSLLAWLEKKGTVFHMDADIQEILPEGVKFMGGDGLEKIVKADSIIPALPLAPDLELFESLSKQFTEIYAIGDCREPGLIPHAVLSGAEIGYRI